MLVETDGITFERRLLSSSDQLSLDSKFLTLSCTTGMILHLIQPDPRSVFVHDVIDGSDDSTQMKDTDRRRL